MVRGDPCPSGHLKRLLPLLEGVPHSWEALRTKLSAASPLGGTPSRDSGVLFPAPGFSFLSLLAFESLPGSVAGPSVCGAMRSHSPGSSPVIVLTCKEQDRACAELPHPTPTRHTPTPAAPRTQHQHPPHKTWLVACGGETNTTAFNSAARPVPLSH